MKLLPLSLSGLESARQQGAGDVRGFRHEETDTGSGLIGTSDEVAFCAARGVPGGFRKTP